MRVLIVGVQEEIRLGSLLQQFGSRGEFPDILGRMSSRDHFSLRMRDCVRNDCKRLDGVLVSSQQCEDEYINGQAARSSAQELNRLSDQCSLARGRLEEEVRQFGRVQVISQTELGWYPLDELTMALVGNDSEAEPARIVSGLREHGVFTVCLYSGDCGTFADAVLPEGAAAVMNEQTMIELLERLLKRRIDAATKATAQSVASKWLPHSLLLLLKEQF